MNLRTFRMWSIATIVVFSLPTSSARAQETGLPPLLHELGIADYVVDSVIPDTVKVDLAGAMKRVLLNNPTLRAVRAQTRVASGRLKQAGLYANPEIVVDVEDFGRQSISGPSQTTLGLTQPLILWGKRSAQREVSQAELSAANADVGSVMLELYRETAETFAALLGAEQALSYAEQRLKLANDIESAVQVKLSEGAVPRSELLRAQAATATAAIERDRARADVDRQRSILSSFWAGGTGATIEGDLRWIDSLPPHEGLQALLDEHPSLKSLNSRLHARQAEVRLAKAIGRPDISAGVGYRRLHDAGDNAVVAGVSLPIPLFDHNQGSIVEATASVEVAQAELEAARLSFRREFRALWVTLENQTREVNALETEVLPATDQALREFDEAYRLGRQPYINVLDAQRTLAETQTRLVEVMVLRAQTAARVESLIGHRLDLVRR